MFINIHICVLLGNLCGQYIVCLFVCLYPSGTVIGTGTIFIPHTQNGAYIYYPLSIIQS